MSDPVLITSEALRKILSSYPYDCQNFLPITKDSVYAAVPVSWFPKFVEWCRSNPLEPYAETSYDCDDMAADRVADAGRAFRENVIAKAAPAFLPCQLRIVPTSEYFGAKFEFNPNGHGTDLVYADDGKIYVYEPQANSFDDLADMLDDHIVSTLEHVGL